MATLQVIEYSGVGGHGAIQAPVTPAISEQTVAYTTSTQSNAFNTSTHVVWVKAMDADAYVAFGVAPAATTSSHHLTSGQDRFFVVTPGQKIAAYDGTS